MKQDFQVHRKAINQRGSEELLPNQTKPRRSLDFSVTLLTGGDDRPYVYGLTAALSSVGLNLDVIGSDELDEPDICNRAGVRFLNLRGDQGSDASLVAKIYRVSAYYWRLIRYAAIAKPKIFHILWNNKFQTFDRTLLMLYYKLLGKRVVLTAHNVNESRRDSKDTVLNRFTLRIQYQLADHIFVHTEKMKSELMEGFGVRSERITVIPFGINNSVQLTSLSSREAKERLSVQENQKTILFFGRIKQYKGLEHLIAAFQRLVRLHDDYQLIIAGRLDEGCEKYWESIQREIREYVQAGRIIQKIEFIPDREIEVYFKAADVLVLPYTEVFQSGVMFLGYSFGLPVVAADVGSLKEEIAEGMTGFAFAPEDPIDLARVIETYFASDLFVELEKRRREIRDFVAERHSWEVVSKVTTDIYANLIESKWDNSRDTARISLSD